MKNEINWFDLKILHPENDRSKEFYENRKRSLSFYKSFILPLYVPYQNKKNFHFSVPDEELTCRIMFNDLANEYKKQGCTDMKSLLMNITKHNPSLTEDKIDILIEKMKEHRQKETSKGLK